MLQSHNEGVLVENLLDFVLCEQLKDLVLDGLESLLIAIHRDDDLLTLLFDFRLLLDDDIAEELLSRGVDVNSRGLHQVSGLVWAAGRGHDDVVKVLLGKKYNYYITTITT